MYDSWVTVMVLILAVAARTLTSISHGCKEQNLNIQRVKVKGSVKVICSDETSPDMRFILCHNGHELSTISYQDNKTKASNTTEQGVELHVDQKTKTAYFTLSDVLQNHSGLYTCEGEILYPPPFKKLEPKQTVVVVEVEHQECQKQERQQCPPDSFLSSFWWPMGCGLLVFYCCLMTCISIIFWHKLKYKQCLQNDYMNMKPRGFRKHPRVQHPAIMGKY